MRRPSVSLFRWLMIALLAVQVIDYPERSQAQARKGAIANAVIASAPMAKALSERRLNGLRDMSGSSE